MNTFKRKALMSAVLGTLGAAGTAQAIYQDPDNLGQALVYPYYTVQSAGGNGFNTYISVVNTTTNVKIVKVRFREGKNSREVLDFNLYLSPNDVWTAAVVPASADATSGAMLLTADKSCTNPVIPSAGVPFRNFEYTGAVVDGLGTGLDRTREGYAEMFDMADLPPGSSLGSAAIHNQATGIPSCAGLVGTSLAGSINAQVTIPTGGLSGTGTLINVNSGRDTMYNANAFDQWSTIPQYQDISTDSPNFGNTFPASSIVVNMPSGGIGTGHLYFSSWTAVANGVGIPSTAGARAASATMMHSDVINEYILDATTASNTDWVLTFPTRRNFLNASSVIPPFSNVLTASGACEEISFTYFNREEATAVSTAGDFSPFPPGAAPNSLCWESTILSVRNGSTNAPTSPSTPSLVLGSQNVTAVSISPTFQNGWGILHFGGVGASLTGLVSDATSLTSTLTPVLVAPVAGAQTFRGLPVVGFMIRTFSNNVLSCTSSTGATVSCQGNYGGSVQHAYRNNNTP